VKAAVRPSAVEDGTAIAKLLLETGLDSNQDPAAQFWKYWQIRGDMSGPRSYVMLRDSNVIAHAGMVPGRYASTAQRIPLGHVIDWSAHRDFPGAGIALMRSVARRSGALLAIGGTRQTRAILPILGFRTCGTLHRYVRTLRPLQLLRNSNANAGWRSMVRLVRNTAWTWTAPAGISGHWSVRTVTADQLATIENVLPRPTSQIAVLERSVELFRYMLTCPIVPIELHAAYRRQQLCGYFAMALAGSQARLIDVWVASEDPLDWQDLLLSAVREAQRRPQIAEVVVWSTTRQLSDCLNRCGFHSRVSQAVQWLGYEGPLAGASELHLQMLDNDAAYLHHPGRDDLWA
jgi:hypothetical protein